MNQSSPTGRPKVLFVTYGGGHVSMMLPVIAQMERSCPDVDCVLMALTTGHLRAKAQRPTLGYTDFLHLVDEQAAISWGERLSAGNTSPDVPWQETQAYMGINYLDLIAQYGNEGAAERFEQQGRYGFYPLHFMRAVIAQLQPSVVVATNSPRSEHAALDAAKEAAIPTVGMVDLFGLPSDTYVTRANKPDWTCVISEVVRQRLIEQDFAPQSVIVTGNPAFDGLFNPSNRALAEQFVAEKSWHGKKIILWAGHVEPYTHPNTPVPAGKALPLAIEASLRRYVQTRDDVALIIRYHPSDWHTYERGAAHPRIHWSEPPREHVHPLILAASAVVVQTSTVGLESAVAGKPVISLENSPASHIWFSLAQLGVSVGCDNEEVLGHSLDTLWAGNAAQHNNAYRADGQAAARVAKHIENLLRLNAKN
jgi:hypothetical protein